MSEEKTQMEVTIFGQTLKIRGDADPEMTLKLAEYVDRKMREVDQSSAAKSSLKVAILAALNIADELFRERDEKENLVKRFESATDRLSQLLNENLSE